MNQERTKVPSLNALRDEIYQDAVAHGLWDSDSGPFECAELIRDEADELTCAAFEWENETKIAKEAFFDELADVIIMCLSVAGHLHIDIDFDVRRKMEINKGRPWKHGKEKKADADSRKPI